MAMAMAKVKLTYEQMKELSLQRSELHTTMRKNGRTCIRFVNRIGNRYISAYHVGKNRWVVSYGKVVLEYDDGKFSWTESLKETFGKSSNGTDIPKYVRNKQEFMEVAKSVGIFEI